jgi:hypothetical protein
MKNCKAKRLQKINRGWSISPECQSHQKTRVVSIAGMTARYPPAQVVNIAGMISRANEIKRWSTL